MRRREFLAGGALLALLGPRAARAGERPTEFGLRNKLRARVVPAPKEKEVVVLLGVRAGAFDEPAGKPHLAHVAEHCLVDAASPGSDEARAVERWFAEGHANAETLGPLMYFDLHLPAEELATAIRVQATRLGGPTFRREVLDREIPRALAEVNNLEQPGGYTGKFAASAFAQAAFHGKTQIPLKADTQKLSIDDVRTFWTRLARPDRAILVVIGNVDPATARREVERAFGKIPTPPQVALLPPPKLKPGRVSATWDVATRHVFLAWPVPAPAERDHAALTLASLLLMQRLALDPQVSALTTVPMASNEGDGFFLVSAQAKPDADLGALEAKLLEHVGRMAKRDALAEAEVLQVRAFLPQMMGDVDLDTIPLPPNVTKMMARGNVELQRMTREIAWGDLSAYAKRARAVDGKAIRAAVGRHLDPAKATIVRLEPGL
jgi:predicted Zn-dependent peptidase